MNKRIAEFITELANEIERLEGVVSSLKWEIDIQKSFRVEADNRSTNLMKRIAKLKKEQAK